MKQSFFTRYSLLILIVLTFSLPFVLMGTRRALRSNRNDVKTWLPDGFEETRVHGWFEDHFPHEQFILASWEGCTLDDSRLEMMARKLEPPREESLPAAGKEERKQYFKNVLTGQRLIAELEARYTDLTQEEILQRLEGSLIGKDHEKTCLVVTLAETYHGEELAAVLQRVRHVAANECAIPAADLHLGGPPVDNAAIDFEGKRTLMRLAGWSAVIGLGISWLCFRSVRLTLMIFICAVLAAGFGMAIVSFTGGTVDAILLSMPSLVYVLAMSGAIHIINYYHDAVHEHGLDRAPERALAHAWKPCFVAALTTALGLVSLCKSNLLPIRNFGFYSAVGVMATLVLLFLVLPACLYLWPSRQFAAEAAIARREGVEKQPSLFLGIWRMIGGWVIGRNRLVALACTGWMIFFAIGAWRTNTTISFMKLFSPEAKILADYAWLEHHIGPLVPMEVVLRVDNEKCKLNFIQRERLARDVELAVEQLDAVGGALSVATLAPDPGPTTFGRRDWLEDSVTSKRMEKHRDEFREYLSVDPETNEELWRVSARVDALGDLDYGAFVDDLRLKVEPVIQVYRANGVEGIEVTYTGLVPLIYKAQTELLRGLFTSLIMAFVLIAGVMMFVLRSFSAGLLAMIPNLFPVMVIFGMMGWLGILVDVGSMMTASVALGVAVDDTIHYLTWFRDGIDQGLNRKKAALAAYERCATAMSQTTLISGLGLAVFALSTFTPTQRFGYLMLTLLFAALFGDLIFLPALLTGPLGRFFGRDRAKRQKDLPPGGMHHLDGDVSTSREPAESDVDFRAATVPLRRDTPHRSTKVSFHKIAMNLVARFIRRNAPDRSSRVS